VSNDIKKYLN